MDEQKEQILNTALKYFLQHGLRKITNDSLVSILGISTKTIYKHFKSKEKLIEETLHLYHDRRYEMLQSQTDDQNAACLLFDIWRVAIETEPKVSKVFYQDLGYYYPNLASEVEQSISKKFSDRFIEIIKRGIKEKTFRKDIMPEVVLECVYALYVAIVRHQICKSLLVSPFEIMLNIMGVYFRGFCTKEGAEMLDKHISQFANIQTNRKTKTQIVLNA